MNDVPGARQSRDPACAAAQVNSPTSTTIKNASFVCQTDEAFLNSQFLNIDIQVIISYSIEKKTMFFFEGELDYGQQD